MNELSTHDTRQLRLQLRLRHCGCDIAAASCGKAREARAREAREAVA